MMNQSRSQRQFAEPPRNGSMALNSESNAGAPSSARINTGTKVVRNTYAWPGSQFILATPQMSPSSARSSAQRTKATSTLMRLKKPSRPSAPSGAAMAIASCVPRPADIASAVPSQPASEGSAGAEPPAEITPRNTRLMLAPSRMPWPRSPMMSPTNVPPMIGQRMKLKPRFGVKALLVIQYPAATRTAWRNPSVGAACSAALSGGAASARTCTSSANAHTRPTTAMSRLSGTFMDRASIQS